MIDGVNRETIYTQMMQSIDTMSVPQEGVGGFSLIKVGKDVRQAQNLGQAKLLKKPNSWAKFSSTLDCKNHKISVQVMSSIRVDKSI